MGTTLSKRIIPAAAVEDPDDAVPLAEAVLAGGLDILEITFRTDAAEQAIRNIAGALPDLHLGAGTVLQPEQLQRAVDAGVTFAVAPGSNEAVVRKARELGILFAPGVTTPTEIERAMGWGCSILKFFPAEALGGVATLKALAGPYGHTDVTFIPTGGINASNAKDYLDLPVVSAVGGSWMVARKLVRDRNWPEITRLTTEAVAVARASGVVE